MNKQLRGSLSILTATVIWGFSFIAQSVGMDLMGPFTFQMLRCLLAVVFLIPFSFVMELGKGSFRKSAQKWTDRRLWKVGLICGCALFIGTSLQQMGLVYTDAGKAGFITAMYIVMVPILGLFLKQKPPKTAFISVGLAVVGLYLLSCVGVTEINKGDLLVLGCAMGFAIQITIVDRMAGDVDGFRLNCVQSLVVAGISLPIVLLTEELNFVNILSCWLPLLFAGVLSMGLAFSLQIVGQKDLEPTTASLIMSLESVFAALGGWWLLGERMTAWELAGCGLVFTGVLISQLPDRRK